MLPDIHLKGFVAKSCLNAVADCQLLLTQCYAVKSLI